MILREKEMDIVRVRKEVKRYTWRFPCSPRTGTGSNMGWPRHLPPRSLKPLEQLASPSVLPLRNGISVLLPKFY
jgi:hypothetical protein